MAIPYVHTWWQNKFLIKIATSNCIDMYVNVRNCRDNIGNFAMENKNKMQTDVPDGVGRGARAGHHRRL